MKLDTTKLMNSQQILEYLFNKDSRPSLRWLHEMRKKRAIPFIKWGHRVFFDPVKVKETLVRRHLIRDV